MADKIDRLTAMQIEKSDGTRTDDIPVGAKASNIDMDNDYNVQETIGEIDVAADGDIATQLKEIHDTVIPSFDVEDNTLYIKTK